MNIAPRILAIVMALALVIGGLMLWQTLNARQHAAQAKQDAKGADAYAGAAKGAVATVVANQDSQASLSAVVNEAAKDIAAADGAEQPITPEVKNAALSAACKLPAYAKEPRCAALR